MITVENVSKTIKGKTILSNISFEIATGDCLALIGPNGAGKTTLMSCLLGDLKISKGSILLNNLSPRNRHLKEMIAVIGKVVGVEPKIRELPMQPGDVDRTYADVSKAKALIGYEPKTSFEQGIQKFVNWYKENKELYK